MSSQNSFSWKAQFSCHFFVFLQYCWLSKNVTNKTETFENEPISQFYATLLTISTWIWKMHLVSKILINVKTVFHWRINFATIFVFCNIVSCFKKGSKNWSRFLWLWQIGSFSSRRIKASLQKRKAQNKFWLTI